MYLYSRYPADIALGRASRGAKAAETPHRAARNTAVVLRWTSAPSLHRVQ